MKMLPSPIKIAALLLLVLPGSKVLLADVSSANLALQSGNVANATTLLQATLASDSQNPTAHQLLCRVYFAQEMADPAIHECELAAAEAPANSDNQMWLGRVYGLKASRSGLITAYQFAKKVRSAFERAVQLDPNNVHALSDLGEYYVDAPGFLGGGANKAQALASGMQPRFPSQAHRLLALVALDRKDIATAEAEFKAAIVTSNSPEAHVDLAHFYQSHGRPDDAVSQIDAAITVDRPRNAALVDAASILIAAHRSPGLAERLMRDYLASPAKSDEAPAFRVHMKLGNLLKQQGDPAGAQREYAAAATLAPAYWASAKAMPGL